MHANFKKKFFKILQKIKQQQPKLLYFLINWYYLTWKTLVFAVILFFIIICELILLNNFITQINSIIVNQDIIFKPTSPLWNFNTNFLYDLENIKNWELMYSYKDKNILIKERISSHYTDWIHTDLNYKY